MELIILMKSKDDYISSISIDVTNRCNLSCKHCYNSSGSQIISRNELSDEELMNAAHQFIEVNPLNVCICGGEPLIRKDVVLDMIRLLKSKIQSVNMVSNGWFIDEECAKSLKEAGIDLIQISVDGYNAETHDWLRNKPGSFDHAITAIDCLINEGIRVGVSCAPTKKSIPEIENLIKLLDSKGVYIFRMQPLMYLGRGKQILDCFPDSLDYARLSRKLISVQKDANLRIEWGDPSEHLLAMSAGQNMHSLTINSYGDLLLTPYFPIAFGNIRNHTISEYVSSGLCRIYKHPVFSEICRTVDDEFSLDVSSHTGLPELYNEEFIQIDCMNEDFEKNMNKLREMVNLG